MQMSRRAIPYTPNQKPLSELTIALVSTAGVHMKSQDPFDLSGLGDTTYREIPGDVDLAELTISHSAPKEHYDPTDAIEKDMNCMFPLQRLRELAEAGEIGGVADKHYSMMGYAMRLAPLLKETIPTIAKLVERSRTDAVLLTAGCPLCHRTVVTVQRAIEMAGIPTVLITLDTEQSGQQRPPRAIHPKGFKFGHSLGDPNNVDLQMKVLRAALQQLVTPQEPGQIHSFTFPEYKGDTLVSVAH